MTHSWRIKYSQYGGNLSNLSVKPDTSLSTNYVQQNSTKLAGTQNSGTSSNINVGAIAQGASQVTSMIGNIASAKKQGKQEIDNQVSAWKQSAVGSDASKYTNGAIQKFDANFANQISSLTPKKQNQMNGLKNPSTGFNSKLNLPKFITGGNLSEYDKIKNDIIKRLKIVENSKTNPSGGWDEESQLWKPHKSKEGGAKTVAYGFKLDPNNKAMKNIISLVNKNGGLTDKEVDFYLPILVDEYISRAKSAYNKAGYDWDSLPWKAKSILSDYAYNPGLNDFPKLMKAFDEMNREDALANSHRALNGLSLTERNKQLDKEIKEFFNDAKPQVWQFGTMYRSSPDKNTEQISYEVKNGKPAKITMQISPNWFVPNDTIYAAYNPKGELVGTHSVTHSLSGDREATERFDEINKKYNHDRQYAKPVKRLFGGKIFKFLM